MQLPYLEGQGHLVSGVRMGICRVIIWIIGIIRGINPPSNS